MGSTRVTTTIPAPRDLVYAALLDPKAIPLWRVPRDMRCVVHEWDARVGGELRVSLTYEDPAREGKTAGRTDTYRGRFIELVPGERVVEVDEFETDDPALAGTMTTTVTLADAPGGSRVTWVHDGIPDGVAPEDNEAGTREALARLAELLELSS